MIEQASLVIGEGNWAVKSDSLLGYKINGGKYYPREMSVVRATTGTRINEDGLVELVPYNLLNYSEQFDNVAWTKFNATVTANTAVAPDGNTTADTITSNASSGGDVYLSINISGVHTLSAYFKEGTTNICRLGSTVGGFADFNLTNQTYTLNSGISASITSVGNGWNRCTLTVDITSTTLIYLSSKDISTKTVYAWGAQLVEGSSALDYLPTTDRLDVARIDYSSGSGALLVEPQRTNLVTYSSSFDNAAWIKNQSTITSNYSVSPQGIQNASRWLSNSGATLHYLGQSINFTLGQSYTVSCYVKSNTISNQNFRLFIQNSITSSDFTATSEWQRITFTATTTFASGVSLSGIGRPSSNAAVDLLIYGFQLELGSYPTSYIPTQAATVTRNADVISKTGITDLIGQTEGTIFVEFINDNNSNASIARIISLSDGTANNRLYLAKILSGASYFVSVASGTQTGEITGAIMPQGIVKIALAYNTNDVVMYVNGSLVGSDLFHTTPATSNLYLGQENLGTASLCKPYNAVALYKTRLTNAELATLTTI